MVTRFVSWIFGLTILLTALGLPALAESKRVALVIGNAAYKHSSELRNPRNDAQDVADALKHMGFTVIAGFDLDQSEMRRTIGRFAQALEGAAVGVFYYAGHGMQLNGTNYLVPTDSKLENQYSPEFELIPFGMVQRVMEENKKRTNILFLDACRDNPLARNLARAMGTRSTSVQLGLSPTESGIGTLISFSTQPGNVALDGTGRNSPYADALVKQLRQTGVPITDMLLNVRREVRLATNDRQITWEHSALSERFYFAPPKPVVVVAPPPPPTAPAAKPVEEQDPAELTPAQRTRLSTRLNRELRRVGCDPRATGGTWTATSQDALQRFAIATKLALHTDEPTQAALDAVVSHKFIVCPRIPVAAVPRVPDKPAQTPVAATLRPTIVTPPAIVDPAAIAPPPAAVPPIVVAPPPAVSVPEPVKQPAAVTPSPATAKPSKVTPHPVPHAAAVKSPPPPPPPPPAVVQPAPFSTSIQREKTCRLETWQECANRLGNPAGVTSICPPAARKEICPGSTRAAPTPSFAKKAGRETKRVEPGKNCRRETVDECYRRSWSLGNQNMAVCPTERVVCQ